MSQHHPAVANPTPTIPFLLAEADTAAQLGRHGEALDLLHQAIGLLARQVDEQNRTIRRLAQRHLDDPAQHPAPRS